MKTPACRACYAATLTPDELTRFNSEPPTGPVHMCAEHQRGLDELLRRIPITYGQLSAPLSHLKEHRDRRR